MRSTLKTKRFTKSGDLITQYLAVHFCNVTAQILKFRQLSDWTTFAVYPHAVLVQWAPRPRNFTCTDCTLYFSNLSKPTITKNAHYQIKHLFFLEYSYIPENFFRWYIYHKKENLVLPVVTTVFTSYGHKNQDTECFSLTHYKLSVNKPYWMCHILYYQCSKNNTRQTWCK
jgi:hypothetical protein